MHHRNIDKTSGTHIFWWFDLPTKNFDADMIVGLMSPEYQCYIMSCSACDVGHAGTSRERTYIIMRHVEKTQCLYDPHEMYSKVASYISSKVATEPKDYMVASDQEIALEAMAVARQRGIVYQPYEQNLAYLLTLREREVLRHACLEYYTRFGQRANSNPNLAIFLGDNFSWSLTWSAVSNKIPGFRLNSGKTWFPYFARWMCHSEKLACFGFPIRGPLASSMGLPALPIKDERRAAGLAGNCMNLPVVTTVMLVALSCIAEKGKNDPY